ncbi:MAG: ATPase domain-containing protein [Candidatus Hodarchaeota archaeon]
MIVENGDLRDLPSMTNVLYNILLQNGILDTSSLATTDIRLLIKLDIHYELAEKVISEACDWLDQNEVGFIFGEALVKTYKENVRLTSGCQSLDEILGGGFSTKKIYEFYGPEKVGKTILIHQLLCRAMLPTTQGGLRSPVVYFDTEGNFSLKRIRAIAPRFGLDPEIVLENIARMRIGDSDELLIGLSKHLFDIMERIDAKIILVDSIISNVRAEYIGEANLSTRQGLLGKYLNALKRATQQFDAIAIITNQITWYPSRDNNSRTYSHCGGNILGHGAQVRVEMKFMDYNSSYREFILEKAVDLEQNSCILKIRNDGFHDNDKEVI